MAAHVERPLILPLSNPTSLAEATPDRAAELDRRARDDRHRLAVPRRHARRRVTHQIAQANNALVFPGIGLGRRRVPRQPGDRRT
jgi:malate dehydrogenase (oxaloacetate-decarboxylating)